VKARALVVAIAFIGAASVAGVSGGCGARSNSPTVIHGTQALKAYKGRLGGQDEPLPLGPVASPWPNFYGPTQYDFDRAHLSAPLRKKVLALVERVPLHERLYARWLPWQRGIIVFEVKPDQIRSDGRGYSPSKVLNEPNLFVDPTNGNIFAGPP